MLRGRTVAVGVSGGIAAYKAAELVRWLQQRGASVIVIMTPAAVEFVTPLTFQALSGNPVVTDLWGNQRPGFDLPPAGAARVRGRVEHVDVAEAAECLVIAPATADLMARLVHGEAPDALTTVALASRAPLVLCPAMDLQMWRQPSTQSNLRALKARGAIVIGPDSGSLASGLVGPGRLAEIETIGLAVERAVEKRRSLAGMRVLVGAGRTEEPIDPVRVLTNRSSGKMGFALAEAARDRGARVTLVAGVTSLDPPHGVELVSVGTAAEMERAMRTHAARAELVLMAAAVADYRPATIAKTKLKRTPERMQMDLVPNPDILAGIAKRRRPGQVLVGFALETTKGLAHARAKLKAKGVDLMVLNSPREGLGGDTNRVTLVEAKRRRALPRQSKREVAEAILERALELRPAPRHGRGASATMKRATTKRGGTKAKRAPARRTGR
jgi:phosphopantothenoylcysteine decarboxylase/phosphopantothenate--cysteine ligase